MRFIARYLALSFSFYQITINLDRICLIVIVGNQISGQIKLHITYVRQYSTLTEKEDFIIHTCIQSKLLSNIIGKMITSNVMTKLSSFRHTRHQIYHPILDHQVDVFMTRTKLVDTRIKMITAFTRKLFDTHVVRNLL